jgi:hypothetical protein
MGKSAEAFNYFEMTLGIGYEPGQRRILNRQFAKTAQRATEGGEGE